MFTDNFKIIGKVTLKRRVKVTLKEAIENKIINFNFKPFTGQNRAEYAQWVLEWKVEYTKLTENTRYMKHRRKSLVYGAEVSQKATNICRRNKVIANQALEYRLDGKIAIAEIWIKERLAENV